MHKVDVQASYKINTRGKKGESQIESYFEKGKNGKDPLLILFQNSTKSREGKNSIAK